MLNLTKELSTILGIKEMKKIKLIAFFLCLISFMSCGKKEFLPQSSASNLIDGRSNEWTVKEITTKEGDVFLKEETLSAEQVELIEKEKDKIIKLEEISISAKTNTRLFRMTNKETNQLIFVEPRIFSFAGNTLERKTPIINERDGTTTLFFPIMLVDGLTSTIPSPFNRRQSIEIPKSLLVNDQVEIKDFITKRYGGYGNQELSRLPGCPKEILMTIAGKQFMTSFEMIKSSESCPYNVPINASLTLPNNEALWILQNGLYSGPVLISARFEARIPITTSKFTIEMNKGKLIEKISKRIQLNAMYSRKDLLNEISNIVNEEAARVELPKDGTEHLNSIVQQALDFIFDQNAVTFNSFSINCERVGDGCLKFKKEMYLSKESFSVNWIRTKDLLSDQHIITSAQLIPSEKSNVQFKNLQNNENSKLDTNLVIMNNDLLEIKLTKKILENYIQEKSSSTTHTRVQVGTTASEVCDGIRRSPLKVGYNHFMPFYRGSGGEGGGVGGGNGFCRTIYTPAYVDQWIEETFYTVKKVTSEEDFALDGFDRELDNLSFVFSWFENGEILIKKCAAVLFEKKVHKESIFFKITNVQQCKIFNSNSTSETKISLINSSPSQMITIREGKAQTNWKGEISDLTKTSQYTDNIIFSGEVLIRSYNLKNLEGMPF